MKKIIVYETVQNTGENKKKKDEALTKEERINLIRYGPDAGPKEETKVAINLLRKYKPMINLNRYRKVAKDLEEEVHRYRQFKQQTTWAFLKP